LSEEENYFDQDFRDLFEGITHIDPEKRFSIEKVKESKWFNKEVYEQNDLKMVLR